MYINHTQLVVALGSLVVNHFADSLASRTHADDDILGISGTIVVERTVFATGNLRDLVHIVAHDVSHSIIIGITTLAMGEEYIGVLSHTFHNRVHRTQSTLAELLQRLHIHQRTEVFHIHHLNLLILVAGTETVEEIEERHTALDSREVSHTGEVHHLLYAALGEHSETGLTASHHVLMVAKDTKHVACQRTSRHVENGRNQFARNLVHVRNHQQQTLRSSKRSGQGTGIERTMYCTCSTALRLHLLNHHGLAEHVLAPGSRPLVYVLCHRRTRRDRIDSRHLGEHIRDMRRSSVTITRHKLFFFHLFCN